MTKKAPVSPSDDENAQNSPTEVEVRTDGDYETLVLVLMLHKYGNQSFTKEQVNDLIAGSPFLGFRTSIKDGDIHVSLVERTVHRA